MHPNISCYGYDNGRIPGLNCSVKHDQSWNVCHCDLTLRTLDYLFINVKLIFEIEILHQHIIILRCNHVLT